MKDRMLQVDGLRGVACVGIVFGFHCRNFFSMSWMEYLAYFVEVFFIISGFMMAYNYKDKIVPMGFKSYFSKRYINLMCIYWVTFLLWVVLLGTRYLVSKEIDYTTFNIVNLFLEFFGVLSGWIFPSLGINSWFFNVLLLCYLLYYVLCKVSSGNNKNIDQEKYLFFCMIMLTISLVGMANAWNFPFFYAGITLRGEASFAVGLLLYEISQFKRVNTIILVGDTALIMAFVLFVLYGEVELLPFMGNISFAMILVICPMLVMNVIYNSLFKRVFSLSILRWIGEISMNVYLWHTICLYFVVRFIGVNKVGYCMMIISSLVVGSISHYFLEPQIKRFLNKMICA